MDFSGPPPEAAARLVDDTMARARGRLAALEHVGEELAGLGEDGDAHRRRERLLAGLVEAFGPQPEAT
ncbi:MAG TPA: hypothetical protein VL179_02435 [Mycobacterium sp.]|nr:hypothetical protein [Mycobacterium sp.]